MFYLKCDFSLSLYAEIVTLTMNSRLYICLFAYLKYGIICCVFLILSSACARQGGYIQDVPFTDVLHQAQQTGKPVWMMLGGGEGCTPCNILTEDMQRLKLFGKYKNDFIFYKCNVNTPENAFLHHIFLMESIPNSYIMDSNGNIVSYQFHATSGASVEQQLQSFMQGLPYNSPEHGQFSSNPPELLRMQNALLNASLLFQQNQFQQALDYTKQSTEIEPCFYNLYVLGKIYAQLKHQHAADSCASLATNYLRNTYQETVFGKLMGELQTGYDTTHLHAASITYDSDLVDCGTIRQGKKHQIEFGFTNNGDTPLVIQYVVPSCGCSKPTWPKQPIMPQERGTITVDYEADRFGFFRHYLTVYSNTKEKNTTLTFQGEVIK